ncbi:MAG: hypothetical protein WC879_00125 [Melioribacteraceae bacterium]
MTIKLSKNASKFLDSVTEKEKNRIREKVKKLFISLDQNGIIPFKEMDIKKLEGEWNGFMRMRIGKNRVIFKIDGLNKELLIYEIDNRGSVYK